MLNSLNAITLTHLIIVDINDLPSTNSMYAVPKTTYKLENCHFYPSTHFNQVHTFPVPNANTDTNNLETHSQ